MKTVKKSLKRSQQHLRRTVFVHIYGVSVLRSTGKHKLYFSSPPPCLHFFVEYLVHEFETTPRHPLDLHEFACREIHSISVSCCLVFPDSVVNLAASVQLLHSAHQYIPRTDIYVVFRFPTDRLYSIMCFI